MKSVRPWIPHARPELALAAPPPHTAPQSPRRGAHLRGCCAPSRPRWARAAARQKAAAAARSASWFRLQHALVSTCPDPCGAAPASSNDSAHWCMPCGSAGRVSWRLRGCVLPHPPQPHQRLSHVSSLSAAPLRLTAVLLAPLAAAASPSLPSGALTPAPHAPRTHLPPGKSQLRQAAAQGKTKRGGATRGEHGRVRTSKRRTPSRSYVFFVKLWCRAILLPAAKEEWSTRRR